MPRFLTTLLRLCMLIMLMTAMLPDRANAAAAPDSPGMQALAQAPVWINGMLNDEPAQMLSIWGHPEQARHLRRIMLLRHWQAVQSPSGYPLPATVSALQAAMPEAPELPELGAAYLLALNQALTADLSSLPDTQTATRGTRWEMQIRNQSALALALHTGTRLLIRRGNAEWLARCESPAKQTSPLAPVALLPNAAGTVSCELLQASGPLPAGEFRLIWQVPAWRDDLTLNTVADQLAAALIRPSLHDRFYRCEHLGTCQPATQNSAAAPDNMPSASPAEPDNTGPERPVPLSESMRDGVLPPLLSLEGWSLLWLFSLILLTWQARTAIPGTLLVIVGGCAATREVYHYALIMPHDSMGPWFVLLLAGGFACLTVIAALAYAAGVTFWKQRPR